MRKPKPYTSTSLPAAIREVRMLRKLRDQLSVLLDRYHAEREIVAMLAADTPQFDNPLHAMRAKQLRDEILKYPTAYHLLVDRLPVEQNTKGDSANVD